MRQNARQERERILRERAEVGRRERKNDFLVGEEKARLLEENRQRAANVYSGLYANSSEARLAEALAKEHSLQLISRGVGEPEPGLKRSLPPVIEAWTEQDGDGFG